MDKKIVIISLFVILFISMASASSSELTGCITNQPIQLIQTSPDATYNNITVLKMPNGTQLNINSAMNKDGTTFSYSYTPTISGKYIINGVGNDGGTTSTWNYYMYCSLNGEELSSGKAISYIGFICILLLILIMTIWGAIKVKWKLPRKDGKILGINNFRYLKITFWSMVYLEVMFLFGLSYKFFNESNMQGFTDFFNFIYQLLLNLMYPLLIVLIIVFVMIFLNNKKLNKRLKLGIHE